MYEVVLTDLAKGHLRKLPQETQHRILKKIQWLARNVAVIKHERLQGHREFSLHSGQFRIPYTLDHENQCIYIEDIGKHDEVYQRLRRR